MDTNILNRFSIALLNIALAPFLIAQTATITEIEVNQALGKQFKGAMHFVAGKDTVVRAFLDAEITIDPTQTRLAVLRAGADKFELQAKSYDGPVKIVEFLCPTREDCGRWAEGSYTFTATVNGVVKSTEGTAFDFKTRSRLRIMVRPVKSNYGGKIVQVRDSKWKTAWGYLQSVYPVAADAILWDIKDEFDATDEKYDLETEPGRAALWESLTSLIPQKCAANPKADGCFELVVGFIPDRPNGNLQGYTYGRPTNIVVASDEDMPATIAHEIAHIYNAGDTYNGGTINCEINPAPDGYNGNNFNDPENPVACMAGKLAFPTASATMIPADARPYEVNGRGALLDAACWMGSGGKQTDFWVSQEVYANLFNALDPATSNTPSMLKAPSLLSASAPERLLYFSGYLNKANRVQKDPWYTYFGTEIPVDTTGDIMVRALAADNAVLATQRLAVSFFVLSNPPVSIQNAPFTGVVRFPAAAAKVQIVRRDPADASRMNVLWESAVSSADPELASVFASATETVDNLQTITWSAKASSGQNLFYLVEYNSNVNNPASEWLVLAADIQNPSLEEDFSHLPGGVAARIRVTATDGIRAAAAESKSFKVPFKAPEVFISDLAAPILKLGLDLTLSAEVEDLQDDLIPDAKLIWTSSISGILGRGTDIVAKKLAAGDHVITFTATNSAGLSASQSVKLTVR